jgi:hypothetical protein
MKIFVDCTLYGLCILNNHMKASTMLLHINIYQIYLQPFCLRLSVFFTKYVKRKSRETIPLNLTCRERNKAPDAVGVQTDEHQSSSDDKTGDPCNHNSSYFYSNNDDYLLQYSSSVYFLQPQRCLHNAKTTTIFPGYILKFQI